jgi:hypothetical protein
MAVIDNAIRVEEDKSLSFGNYTVTEKQKINDFNVDGDIYKLRTHNEITKLAKNEKLLIETYPGAAIHNFKVSEKETTFGIEGYKSTSVTLELEAGATYSLFVDDVNLDKIKANLSGKLNFSIELNSDIKNVKIEKIK